MTTSDWIRLRGIVGRLARRACIQSTSSHYLPGIVNKVGKKPPPPPPHLHAAASVCISLRNEPEAVYYSQVEDGALPCPDLDIDIDNLPPPLPPHKEELSLTTDARKWYASSIHFYRRSEERFSSSSFKRILPPLVYNVGAFYFCVMSDSVTSSC